MKSLRLLCAFCVLIFSLPAQAATLDTFDVAGWGGTVYSDETTAQFSHCAISMPYQSGITLVFTIDRKLNWKMGLYNSAWHLKQDASYQLSYAVDDGATIQADGRAIDEHLVTVDLPDTRSVFDQFRYGNQLRLDAAGGTFFFNLTGTSKALTAALECSNKWTSAANRPQASDPFSPQQRLTTPGTGQAEAVAFVANLLAMTGTTQFIIAPPEDAAKILPAYDAVWIVKGAVGGLIVAPNDPGHDVDGIFTVTSAADAKACKGRFASLRQPVEDRAKSYMLGRLVTACEDDAGPIKSYYTLLARPQGGTYLMAVIGSPNGWGKADAESADNKLQDAVYHQLSGDSASQ